MSTVLQGFAGRVDAWARGRGDGLSPVLVKELRQGMRANVFVSFFIILQVVMVLILMGALAEGGGGEASTALFWVTLGTVLIVVFPMVATGAIAQEYRAKTLELILLTRMTAFRIVFGKWVALLLEEFLFVTAVLPYLVVRYQLGGVDLLAELGVLAALAIISAIFTAVAIGFSAIRNPVARTVTIIVCLVMFLFIGAPLIVQVVGELGAGGVVILLVLGLPGCFIPLQIAAGLISPLADVAYAGGGREFDRVHLVPGGSSHAPLPPPAGGEGAGRS